MCGGGGGTWHGSVCGRGHVCAGACMAGGMHDRGVHGSGACMAEGVHGGGCAWWERHV